MKRTVLLLLVYLVGLSPAAGQEGEERIVRVMTRNVYHGVNAEIFAVPAATNFVELLSAVGAVYDGYFARHFEERAQRLAGEIQQQRPDLIGLQEAILVRTQSPPDGQATWATYIELDYVQMLLDALAARGLAYEVVVQSINFDVELPSFTKDVRHTVRDVILARSDAPTSELKLSNAQAGNFVNNCLLPGPPIPGLPRFIEIRRGWAAVDVKTRGQSFRFVNTHLDGDCLPFTSAIQEGQAREVLAGPGSTSLPLLLVGDLNSPADGTNNTYNWLIGSGFSDAWTLAGEGPGMSCCQSDNLLNPVSSLGTRIDFVLFRGNLLVRRAIMVGDLPGEPMPSGLVWPSDHAGLAVELVVPNN